MTTEDYLEKKAELKKQKEELIQFEKDLREFYIKSSAPCKIDDEVEIISQTGRRITGIAKSFSIFHDGEIYVDTIHTPKRVYFSKPYQSIKVTNQLV